MKDKEVCKAAEGIVEVFTNVSEVIYQPLLTAYNLVLESFKRMPKQLTNSQAASLCYALSRIFKIMGDRYSVSVVEEEFNSNRGERNEKPHTLSSYIGDDDCLQYASCSGAERVH